MERKRYHATVFVDKAGDGTPSVISEDFTAAHEGVRWAEDLWHERDDARYWKVMDSEKDIQVDEGGDASSFKWACIDPSYRPRLSDAMNDYWIDVQAAMKRAVHELKERFGDQPIPIDEWSAAMSRATMSVARPQE